MNTPGANPYLDIGVRPFINCCSTRSVHGGSIMLPEVRAAMENAAGHFVNINELMAGASARIAALTGAPWGIVTCGSAAAIVLATAAAIAGNDPLKMLALPFTDCMVRRVVMPRSHRFPYDQAIRMVGAEIIEVASVADLEALDFSTIAMMAIVGSRDAGSTVTLEDLIRFARPNGIPVLVDAASEHLTLPNPWLERSADLVIYSGGKVLRGPQTSALLLGRRDLVDAAWANSNPHRAFGRPMKVGKEDVIGLLKALELWFERDRSGIAETWRADLETIARHVTAVPGCSAELLPPDAGDEQPQLKLAWSRALVGIDGLQLRQRLLDGTPRIMLDDVSALQGAIIIEPFSLQPGEAEIVGRAIATQLATATPRHEPVVPAGSDDVTGSWMLEIDLLPWPRHHRMWFAQQGETLGGSHACPEMAGPLSGTRRSNCVTFAFETIYEATIITFNFSGTVTGDIIEGDADLGSTTPGTRGIVSYTQYGKARWRARRCQR